MLGTIYTGLAGMTAYSRGLDVVSNNVANLNTPGFKLTEPAFHDIERQAGQGALATPQARGAGVAIDVSHQSLRAGELRATGNELDAAIEGNGFFVLERAGSRLYTRAGQFEFDRDGFLVARDSQAKVLMQTDNATLQFFNINEFRVFAPQATTELSLVGNLARADEDTYSATSLVTIDTAGGTQILHAQFTRDASEPLRWTVELLDKDEHSLGTGSVLFTAEGTPADGQDPLRFEVQPTGLPAYTIMLHMGEPGSFAGVVSTTGSVTSTVQLLKQDGVALGALTANTFDENGQMQLTYSNAEVLTPARLLLATVSSPQALQPLDGGLFSVQDARQVQLGVAQTQGLGRIVSEQIELSNVDLTSQFTDLIILQRGYQASSQMLTVANEMLQQLLAMQGAR